MGICAWAKTEPSAEVSAVDKPQAWTVAKARTETKTVSGAKTEVVDCIEVLDDDGTEAKSGAEAGIEAGDIKITLKEFKRKIETLEKVAMEQSSRNEDLALQIEGLKQENGEYKNEIESLKQTIERLKEDALQDKRNTQVKEAQYQKQIKTYESKIDALEKQLEEKNKELHVERSKTMQSMEKPRVKNLTYPLGKFESHKLQVTSPDLPLTMRVHSGDRHMKKKTSSEDSSLWKY